MCARYMVAALVASGRQFELASEDKMGKDETK
jgi:hypothetical protein